jgi:CO/xanthine dehydrogenase Mo-binding subunit
MSPIRADAALKLQGNAPYGTDLSAEGMLWGALVFSPIAHGKIRRVDLAMARQIPGVVAIGAEDLAGLLPAGATPPETPLFPTDEVVYRYQPLAAVAAPTRSAARDAAERVRVEIEPREVWGSIDDLLPEWPGSSRPIEGPLNAHIHARHGDVGGAFRSADFVLSETYRTSGVHQVPLEPHACLARIEGDRWRVITSTQTPFGCREDVAGILGIPEKSLVVEGSWVGGAFGAKGSALLEPYALLLARASGRPVKLQLTYPEEFLLGRSTLPSVVRIESAVRGRTVVARRVRLLLDTGASLPGRDFTLGYAAGFLLGPYSIPAVEVEGYALRTHKPPFGPHRAPFIPQCAFVVESHTDHLARRLGIDPVEFRRSQVWTEGSLTGLGQRVGPFGVDAALARAADIAREWRRDKPAGHGVGVAAGFWSTGTGAGGEARLRLTPKELWIEEGEREIGSGSVVRGIAAVVEQRLGLPAGTVQVAYQDTDSAPFDSGVFGSRTVAALGQAAENAAVALREELGRRLGASKESLRLVATGSGFVVEHGKLRTRIEDLWTPEEAARGGLRVEGKHYGRAGTLDERRVIEGNFHPFTDFVGAVHVAEVRVDPEIGTVEVVRYAAIHDAGRLVDRATAQAGVEGGVVMGLGTALLEETQWGPDGRLENPGLLNYRLPTLMEAPPITVEFIEGFPGAGPRGAKGLGEPPIVPVPGAIANAIYDATGAELFELPMISERVARALKRL